MELGHEVRIIIGNDPPGLLTRLLHPRAGRHGPVPEFVIPVGRTVIVPANASLSNVCLTPQSMPRIKRAFRREQFDVVHVHEPLAPIISQYALAAAPCPIVSTSHAAGGRWWKWGPRLWPVLIPRIDYRIAVSQEARRAAEPCLGGPFEIIPNGVALPESPDPAGRRHHVVFIGRHEPRKGLPVLLESWPEIHRRTGARLRVLGADPLAVRFLLRRLDVPEDGIDILGVVTAEIRDRELMQAKVLAAPAIGSETFGMVLTEAAAAATPVVASDISGYREVADDQMGFMVPPGNSDALARAIIELLEDEPRRVAMGAHARLIAEKRYSWSDIASRLVEIYDSLMSKPAPAGVVAA
jgi:phosphatidylinositol alpha-mannosyltransferase